MFFSPTGKTFAEFFRSFDIYELGHFGFSLATAFLFQPFCMELFPILSSHQPWESVAGSRSLKKFHDKEGVRDSLRRAWEVEMALQQDKFSGPCKTKRSYWSLAMFSPAHQAPSRAAAHL